MNTSTRFNVNDVQEVRDAKVRTALARENKALADANTGRYVAEARGARFENLRDSREWAGERNKLNETQATIGAYVNAGRGFLGFLGIGQQHEGPALSRASLDYNSPSPRSFSAVGRRGDVQPAVYSRGEDRGRPQEIAQGPDDLRGFNQLLVPQTQPNPIQAQFVFNMMRAQLNQADPQAYQNAINAAKNDLRTLNESLGVNNGSVMLPPMSMDFVKTPVGNFFIKFDGKPVTANGPDGKPSLEASINETIRQTSVSLAQKGLGTAIGGTPATQTAQAGKGNENQPKTGGAGNDKLEANAPANGDKPAGAEAKPEAGADKSPAPVDRSTNTKNWGSVDPAKMPAVSDANVTAAQQLIVDALGSDGMKTKSSATGVDGKWGPKSQAQFEALCRAAGIADPSKVNFNDPNDPGLKTLTAYAKENPYGKVAAPPAPTVAAAPPAPSPAAAITPSAPANPGPALRSEVVQPIERLGDNKPGEAHQLPWRERDERGGTEQMLRGSAPAVTQASAVTGTAPKPVASDTFTQAVSFLPYAEPQVTNTEARLEHAGLTQAQQAAIKAVPVSLNISTATDVKTNAAPGTARSSDVAENRLVRT